jgi:type IV conjugative transfer system protein TraE
MSGNIFDIIETVKTQRNIAAVMAAASLLVCCLLSFAVITQDKQVVLLPSIISQEYTLGSNSIHNAYIEDISLDVAHLLLNVSAANVEKNYYRLLENADTDHIVSLKNSLSVIKEGIEESDIATAFHVLNITSNKERQAVILEGTLRTFQSKTIISEEKKVYEIFFIKRRGRLLLKGFEERTNQEEKNEN